MKSLEKNKSVVIAVVVFLAAILAYNTFFKADQAIITEGDAAQAVGNDVLALSQSLDTIQFDTSLFSSAAYRSLLNFSPTLVSQPVGRANPFAPLGQ